MKDGDNVLFVRFHKTIISHDRDPRSEKKGQTRCFWKLRAIPMESELDRGALGTNFPECDTQFTGIHGGTQGNEWLKMARSAYKVQVSKRHF